MTNNFIKGMGITLFVVGLIGALAIIFTFDFDAYEVAKRSFSEELSKQATEDLIATITYAITALLGTWFMGTVLLALERILIAIEKE